MISRRPSSRAKRGPHPRRSGRSAGDRYERHRRAGIRWFWVWLWINVFLVSALLLTWLAPVIWPMSAEQEVVWFGLLLLVAGFLWPVLSLVSGLAFFLMLYHVVKK